MEIKKALETIQHYVNQNDKKEKTISELQKEIHQTAIDKGWWKKCENCDGVGSVDDYINSIIEIDTCPVCNGSGVMKRNGGEIIALIHSELSEALEAMRNNNWSGDDGVWEELSDTIIRILDYAESESVDLYKFIIEKINFNKTREIKHGNKEF